MPPKRQPTKKAKEFIAKKISKIIKEGKPPKQAVAIAFSMASKQYPSVQIKKKK